MKNLFSQRRTKCLITEKRICTRSAQNQRAFKASFCLTNIVESAPNKFFFLKTNKLSRARQNGLPKNFMRVERFAQENNKMVLQDVSCIRKVSCRHVGGEFTRLKIKGTFTLLLITLDVLFSHTPVPFFFLLYACTKLSKQMLSFLF